MKILIKNLNNTYNYGSMMMGENLITYLNLYSHGIIDYYIEDSDEKNIERLRKATNFNNIFLKKKPIKKNKTENKIMNFIYRKLNEKILINEYKENYDYIFILGGDDYSEEYYNIKKSGKYLIQLLNNLKKINKKVPVYMLSQTIGPFTGKRKKIAKKTFKQIVLYSRDNKNYQYLVNNLKCDKIRRMYDLAFLDLNLQKEDKETKILEKYNLEKEKYIVFVGTGLMNHYTKNEKDMINQISDLLAKLQTKYADKKIVWLSHVTGIHSNDNIMLNEISKTITKNLVIIDNELFPFEARYIIGCGYFLITCRMHAAVSCLQKGKSCICLSYSPKFSGVIGEEFNMEDFVLELKGTDIWKNDNISEKIINLAEKLEENMELRNSDIKNHIKEIKIKNKEIIAKLAEELEKKND